MYAVIKAGGRQERVETGQTVLVDLLPASVGEEVRLAPVLLVDGESVLARPAELSGVSVKGRVLGESRGPKIVGFTYRPKARARRSWGHRQRYTMVEITGIEGAGATGDAPEAAEEG